MQIKHFYLYLLPLTSYFLLLTSPAQAQETTWENCTVGPYKVATLKCLEVVFERVVTFAGAAAILAFFVMFVMAAFKYLTSGGDPKQTESAKNTMTYAFIGIIVIASAWIILRFIEAFSGVPLDDFTIPEPE